jgi:hypothetical protein
MTRNGGKQPRQGMAPARPLPKALEGQNGTVMGLAGRGKAGRGSGRAVLDWGGSAGDSDHPLWFIVPRIAGIIGETTCAMRPIPPIVPIPPVRVPWKRRPTPAWNENSVFKANNLAQ